MDAPERRQAFGNASRQHLAALCFQQRAQIAPRTTDRYGRLVADVACQGQDAGGELVRSGMAWVYKRYAAKRDAPLSRLEAQARAARAGLWADPAPVAPWEWRRSQRNSPRM
nr:thermonuclease family protein [Acidovorax sp. SUPP1855]